MAESTKPCPKCGGIDRYKINGRCRKCSVDNARQYRIKNLDYSRKSALDRAKQRLRKP